MSTEDPGHWPPPAPSGPPAGGDGSQGPPPSAPPLPPAAAFPAPAAGGALPSPQHQPVAPPPPGRRPGNPFGLTALILGVVALVLAVIPFANFAAGLPALAAIVFGIVGLVVHDRARGTSIAGLIIGAVALIIAIVISAILIAGLLTKAVRSIPDITDFPSDFPTDLPSDGGSGGAGGAAGGLTSGPHTITYRITGSGTVSVAYATIANNHTAFARTAGVKLPSTRTQHVTITAEGSFADFTLTAVTVNGSKPLGCSIAIDDAVVVEHTSRSGSGLETVTCSARPGVG